MKLKRLKFLIITMISWQSTCYADFFQSELLIPVSFNESKEVQFLVESNLPNLTFVNLKQNKKTIIDHSKTGTYFIKDLGIRTSGDDPRAFYNSFSYLKKITDLDAKLENYLDLSETLKIELKKHLIIACGAHSGCEQSFDDMAGPPKGRLVEWKNSTWWSYAKDRWNSLVGESGDVAENKYEWKTYPFKKLSKVNCSGNPKLSWLPRSKVTKITIHKPNLSEIIDFSYFNAIEGDLGTGYCNLSNFLKYTSPVEREAVGFEKYFYKENGSDKATSSIQILDYLITVVDNNFEGNYVTGPGSEIFLKMASVKALLKNQKDLKNIVEPDVTVLFKDLVYDDKNYKFIPEKLLAKIMDKITKKYDVLTFDTLNSDYRFTHKDLKLISTSKPSLTHSKLKVLCEKATKSKACLALKDIIEQKEKERINEELSRKKNDALIQARKVKEQAALRIERDKRELLRKEEIKRIKEDNIKKKKQLAEDGLEEVLIKEDGRFKRVIRKIDYKKQISGRKWNPHLKMPSDLSILEIKSFIREETKKTKKRGKRSTSFCPEKVLRILKTRGDYFYNMDMEWQQLITNNFYSCAQRVLTHAPIRMLKNDGWLIPMVHRVRRPSVRCPVGIKYLNNATNATFFDISKNSREKIITLFPNCSKEKRNETKKMVIADVKSKAMVNAYPEVRSLSIEVVDGIVREEIEEYKKTNYRKPQYCPRSIRDTLKKFGGTFHLLSDAIQDRVFTHSPYCSYLAMGMLPYSKTSDNDWMKSFFKKQKKSKMSCDLYKKIKNRTSYFKTIDKAMLEYYENLFSECSKPKVVKRASWYSRIFEYVSDLFL